MKEKILILISFISLISAAPSFSDLHQIFDGVTSINLRGGCYGNLFLKDENSFSIVKNNNQVFISGSIYGSGRAVAIGHNSPLSSSFLGVEQNSLFI